ncbi:hypothetical protein EDB86DRAFT_3062906 [Lactarius hatsudake]|nr:hypothetical protein EDB86DRAFT_3062906 [Lactarius hatsudake]
MANLIRSPKSGSDWTTNELIAYNITVTTWSPQQFHWYPKPSLVGLDPTLIDSAVDAENVPDHTFRYLTHLDLATNTGQKSLIADFSRETLRLLGYEERGMEGDSTQPEPQVIAGAIAAYQHNNEKRQTRGLPALDAMTIPCITMVGTRPTFYVVPVTQALSVAVVTGQYPKGPTEALKCVTFLGHNRRSNEGMETPEYRRLAFQWFVAFKILARGYWKTFLV